MPDFIIPEEADRCPHCGGVLYDPPNCCAAMMAEHDAELAEELEGVHDDYPDFAECPVCFGMMEPEQCWQCLGQGGFHECGEDCCMCLDKEEITQVCDECHGEGKYLVCMSLPHTDEQMKAYSERLEKAK